MLRRASRRTMDRSQNRLGRAMAAHDGALDRAPADRCRPVAGEVEARRSASSTPGAARRPARARTSRAARERRRAATSTRAARAGSDCAPPRVPPAPRARRCPARRGRVAPLATIERCDAAVAEDRALVEHPVHRAPRQPDERSSSMHRAVVPEVDGHDRLRRHRARRSSTIGGQRRGRRPPRCESNAYHGTARDRPRVASIALAADLDAARPGRRSIQHARQRLHPHLAAARLDERRAPAPRTARRAAPRQRRSPSRRRRGPNSSASTRTNGARRRDVRATD